MPNELPYLPLFVGDFLVTVSTWPPDRVGAYWLALCYQWEQGGIPADDTRELSGVLHTSRQHALRLWTSIQSKFRRHNDGLWWNRRLEIVRIEARKQVALASERGRKGAAGRWGKGAQALPEHYQSNAQALPEQCLDDAIQFNSSTTPPLSPPTRGGRSRKRRGSVSDADIQQLERTREVKRLMAEEGLSLADASRKVGYH